MANPKTHGGFAILNNGEKALTLEQAAQMTEVVEALQDRPGVVAAVRHQTALALVLVNVISSYVEAEAAAGVPLTEIPILNRLPAFQNSAARLLAKLADLTPDDDAPSAKDALAAVMEGEDD